MNESLIRSAIREILAENKREKKSLMQDQLGEGYELPFLVGQSILKALTPQAHAPASQEDVKAAQEEKTELAHQILDGIGLVPGPGDVADVTNAILYAEEGKYFLSALSLMCLIPAIGSALGGIKLTTRKIPAAATTIIANNSGTIRSYAAKIIPKMPNGDKVSEAVETILSRIEIYKGADIGFEVLETAAVKTTADAGQAATTAAKTAEVWYKAPGVKDRIKDLTRPILTRTLAKMTEPVFKKRLIRLLTLRVSKELENIKALGAVIDKKDVARVVIEHNNAVVKEVLEKLPNIIEEIASSCVIRIIDDPAVANKLAPSPNTLAHVFDYEDKVYTDVLLPRMGLAGNTMEAIESAIENSIIHEFRHLIDKRLGKMFSKFTLEEWVTTSKEFMGLLETISSNMKLTKEQLEYLGKPWEMWVRVESLRDYLIKLGKNPTDAITAQDLVDFIVKGDKNISDIPVDLQWFYTGLRDVFDVPTLQKIADAMNKVLL